MGVYGSVPGRWHARSCWNKIEMMFLGQLFKEFRFECNEMTIDWIVLLVLRWIAEEHVLCFKCECF